MGEIIAIANQKGGAGKTTLAFHLAHALSQRGFKILLVDNDPQANLSEIVLPGGAASLNPDASVLNLYSRRPVTPWRGEFDFIGASPRLATVAQKRIYEALESLGEGLAGLSGGYDLVLVDCLPSLGSLMLAVLGASDRVLIPARPSQFGLAGAESLLEMISKTRQAVKPTLETLGIVLTLLDPRGVVLEREFEALMRERHGGLVLTSTIPRRIGFEESATLRMPISRYSTGADARDFASFVDEFLLRANFACPHDPKQDVAPLRKGDGT